MSDPAVQRRLGFIAATAIVIANMIGTGVFTTTGFMVPNLDATHIMLSWFIGGVAALCGAAAYAELGAMMPRVGGEYVYLKEIYHPAVGFLSGFVSLIVGFSAPIAAAALAFDRYFAAVVPDVPAKWAAIGLVVAMTVLHIVDVVIGSSVQTVFTALKATLIAVFIFAGLTVGDGSLAHMTTALPGADAGVLSAAFWASLVYVSFSYSGWNAAAYIAGEIRDPGKTLPRALLVGTAIVTALYMGLNVVFLYAAPAAELAGRPEVGDVAARALFGPTAGKLLSTLIALALVSSVSAMVMAGPRVYAAMAEDGLFFRVFASRTRRGAPLFSVLLQAYIALVLVVKSDFQSLLQYIGFVLSLFAALTVAGVFVMRAREPDRPRPYRTWGWPVTPALFVAISLWMAIFLIKLEPVNTLVWGGGTLAVGLVLYVLWRMLAPGESPNGPSSGH